MRLFVTVRRYKAYFQWPHYPFRFPANVMMPNETGMCMRKRFFGCT